MTIHRFRFLFTLFLIPLTSPIADAHPQHATLAEADWNAETGRLEVCLRISPGDLEAVLRQRIRPSLVLEDEAAEKAIEEYLRESLQFLSSEGRTAPWSWVGYEVTVPAAWLYFEVPLPEGPDGWTIVNKLLLHLPRQVNTVHVRQGQRQATLEFTAGQTAGRVKLVDRAAATE